MATAKKDEETTNAPGNPNAFVDNQGVKVEQHLDRDPNDPRNVPAPELLPTLDDEVSQAPKDYHGQAGAPGAQNTDPRV